LDQHRARYLQGHIAEEENADSQAEHAIIEPKVARRSNCGAGHTRAIDIIGDVKEENKRKQPKRNMVACAAPAKPAAAGAVAGEGTPVI